MCVCICKFIMITFKFTSLYIVSLSPFWVNHIITPSPNRNSGLDDLGGGFTSTGGGLDFCDPQIVVPGAE